MLCTFKATSILEHFSFQYLVSHLNYSQNIRMSFSMSFCSPDAGQTEIVNMLLTKCKGLSIDAKNNLGFTPLMKAALQGRTKSAKLLLFAGKKASSTLEP